MSAAAQTRDGIEARAVALACRKGISFQAAMERLVKDGPPGFSGVATGSTSPSQDAPQGVNPCPAGRSEDRRTYRGNPGNPAPDIPPDPHDPRPGCCRFIHGDPKSPDWSYCNAKAVRGTSWCREHYAAVYRPPEESRDPTTRRMIVERRRALGLEVGP